MTILLKKQYQLSTCLPVRIEIVPPWSSSVYGTQLQAGAGVLYARSLTNQKPTFLSSRR